MVKNSGFIADWRFSLLLIALICNILFAPLIADLDLGPSTGSISIEIAFTFLLIILVFVVGHNKNLILLYTTIAFSALIFSWINILNPSAFLSILSHLFSFTALTLAITLVIKESLLSEDVTMDTIAGSLCAYLLLGFAFASIYALIDIVAPSSFISFPSIMNTSKHKNYTLSLREKKVKFFFQLHLSQSISQTANPR